MVFLIYGLAFFALGLTAFQQRQDQPSHFSMLNDLQHLGYFGIIHGATEWILLILIGDFYPEFEWFIYPSIVFLNALSFIFLMIFGLKSLCNDQHQKICRSTPVVLSMGWIAIFVWMVFIQEGDIFIRYANLSAISRYFLGFPASLITFIALRRLADQTESLKMMKIPVRIRAMAILFLVYGILAGLIVRRVEIFPATMLNVETFYTVFKFPVELARALTAIGIMILFLKILNLFKWENQQTIQRLTKAQAANRERRLIAQQIHDNVIQNIFATGLQLEALIDEFQGTDKQDRLLRIKDSMNESISMLRDMIQLNTFQDVDLETVIRKLNLLVVKYQNENTRIYFDCNVDYMPTGSVSKRIATQLYFIIQEAVCNAVKHASPSDVEIHLQTDFDGIFATIGNNGKSFDTNKALSETTGLGLKSMQFRATEVGGTLEITSAKSWTQVQLFIPWEASIIEDN